MKIRLALFLWFVVLLLFAPSVGNTQSRPTTDNSPRVADWSGGYFSSFYLIDSPPRYLADFALISIEFLPNQDNDEGLRPDSGGNIRTLGHLRTKNGTLYRFAESHLIEGGPEIKVHCVTVTHHGVKYSFDGRFPIRGREVRKRGLIIGYVHIDGTLTKFVRGVKTAEARIELQPHWIE